MTVATGSRGSGRARAVRPPGRASAASRQGVPVRDARRRSAAITAAYGPQVGRLPGALPAMAPVQHGVRRRPPTPSRAAGCRCSPTWPGATASTSSARTTSRRSASRTDPAEIAAVRATPTCPRPRLGLRRHRTRGLQRGLHVGPATTCAQEGPRAAAERRGAEQEGAADADRADAPADARARTGPDAVENLRPYRLPGTKARIGFATSLPAFVYGDPPARRRPLLGHGALLHALPRPARRQPRDAGRGQPGPLGGRHAAGLAAAGVDDAPPGARPPTRRSASTTTSRRTWSATSPTSPSTGRPRSPSAALRGRRSACTYVGNAQLLPGTRRRATRRSPARPYAGPQARVPGAGALGRAGRPARRAARGGRRAWRPAPATRSRTTTSRRRWWPTCRSRPTPWRHNCISSPRGGWHGPHH